MLFYPHTSLTMCSNAHVLLIHSGSRQLFQTLLYLLRPCSRARLPRLMYRKYGMPIWQEHKIGENKLSIRAKL